MHDLIIKNATVIDGTARPRFQADVAVDGGLVVEVGMVDAPGKEVVDAKGLVLSPGIIDPHTHYDAQLTWDPTASPSPAFGVTTVVIGNCGFTLTPASVSVRDLLIENLSVVEGMDLNALRAGVDWDFESFADYLRMLDRKRPFVNVAAYIGHSSIRTSVMGREASTREATEREIAEMRRILADAMDAGAIGLSTTRHTSHSGYGGVPMPSRLASEDEIFQLLDVLKERRKGIFQITTGNFQNATVDFLTKAGVRTGRPVIAGSALHQDAFPDNAIGNLDACAQARSQGAQIHVQVSCQPVSFEFTLEAAYPLYSLSAWKPLTEHPPEEVPAAVRDAISDLDFRRRFRAGFDTPSPGQIFYGNWDHVEVREARTVKNKLAEGRTIAQLAKERNCDPIDFFFDLALEENLKTLFVGKLLNVTEPSVEPLLRHEAGFLSLSDAGAHASFICDAGYGLHLLGRWVRERGTFTLEEAVYKLTGEPASIFRIIGRGRIATGMAADLLLFDPAAVGFSELRRVSDLPSNGERMLRSPKGVAGVWVNGTKVFDGTDYASLKRGPGQIITKFAN